MKSNDYFTGSNFWFMRLGAFTGLVVFFYTMKRYYFRSIKPYTDGLVALNQIYQHENALREFPFAREAADLWYPLPVGEFLNIQFLLEDAINTSNITPLLAMAGQVSSEIPRFLLTLRAIDKLTALKSKFEDYLMGWPITPFNTWELNALMHIKDSALFWQDIVDWFGLYDEDMSLLTIIRKRLLVMKKIHALTKNNPDYKKELLGINQELFKDAHICILDARPSYEVLETKPDFIANLMIPSGYISSAALKTDALCHMTRNGFGEEPLEICTGSVYLPFKINLSALLPVGLSPEQITELELIFDENFQTRITHETIMKHEAIIEPDMTYAKTLGIAHRFWPNWGVPKQSFRKDPYIADPGNQICSTLVAQDLWKSLQIVDCQLDMWGFTEPLKNPFGDHQRLDTLLPGDLVACGIKYGWLIRVRDPEAEKWVKPPETPKGGKECLSRRSAFLR